MKRLPMVVGKEKKPVVSVKYTRPLDRPILGNTKGLKVADTKTYAPIKFKHI